MNRDTHLLDKSHQFHGSTLGKKMDSFDNWIDCDHQDFNTQQRSNTKKTQQMRQGLSRKTNSTKPNTRDFNNSVDDLYFDFDATDGMPPPPSLMQQYSGDLEHIFKSPDATRPVVKMEPKTERGDKSLTARLGLDDITLGWEQNAKQQSSSSRRNSMTSSSNHSQTKSPTPSSKMSSNNPHGKSSENSGLPRSNNDHHHSSRRVEEDKANAKSAASSRPKTSRHALSNSEHGDNVKSRRCGRHAAVSPTRRQMGGGRRAASLRHITRRTDISPVRKGTRRSVSPMKPASDKLLSLIRSTRSMGTVDSETTHGTSKTPNTIKSLDEGMRSLSARRLRAEATKSSSRRKVASTSPRPFGRRHASVRPGENAARQAAIIRKAKSERQLGPSSATETTAKVEHEQQKRRPSSDRALPSASRRARLSPTRSGISASSPGGRRASNRRLKKSASISPATTRPRVAAPMLPEGDSQSPVENKKSIRRSYRRRASTGTTATESSRLDGEHSHRHNHNEDTTKPSSYSARISSVGSGGNNSSSMKLSPPRFDSRHHATSRRSSNVSSRKYHAAIANIDMDPFAIRS